MMDAGALLCNICPKRPSFSDVSHLLTHVSSKAHLSHYFKLQVRSHQKPQASDLLEEYDRWYKANHLAELLSERMASKEARKKKSNGKNTVQSTAYPMRRDASHKVPPTCPSPDISLPDYLDPRLSDRYPNADHVVGSAGLSLSANYNTPATSFSEAQPHHRTDQTLPLTVYSREPLSSHWKREPDFDSDDENVPILHATLGWSKNQEGKIGPASQHLNRGLTYDPFVDDNDSIGYLHLVGIDKERADEMTRLKGVLWPGMDIFDSATEQMRRKRNQKKDESILKMMEKTSLCVEPTELVFSPTGILRKQRVISGNVEDSSPLKGETPIPKRRAPRPKRVLSQTDSNAQLEQGRKRSKKSSKYSSNRRPADLDEGDLYPPQSPVAPLPLHHGTGFYFSHGGDTDEFSLSLRAFESKSRNGFAVFQDRPSQYKSGFKDQHSVDELPFAVPPSSQEAFFRREMTAHTNLHPPSSTSHTSTILERPAGVSSDKENIEPFLNVHGRIDPLVGWHSPIMKRQYLSDAGYLPQYFFGDAQHSGFSPFKSHDIPVGYSYNPLAASFSKFSAEENPIYTADFKAQSLPRASSPEATISDVDEDDFERLYLDGSSY